MSDTPLFDQTLSDHLLRARREVELAQSRWSLAERDARERAAEAQRLARLQIAQAQREADERVRRAEARAAQAEREARVRQVLAEDEVRTTLALSAPPLPALRIDLSDEEPLEREAPPVPSMEELMRPMPGITRFLDSLLGSPDS